MNAHTIAGLAVAGAALVHGATAAQSTPSVQSAPPPYTWFDPIIDLRALIVGGFVDTPDASAMQRAALDAMTRALRDPYTVYVPPDAEGLLRRQMTGRYVGIGVELDLAESRPVVISALDDSPALTAGLLPGDVILEVDGKSTEGIDSIALDQLLPGEAGTKVHLGVRHPDGSESALDVVRQQIEPVSVKGVAREGDGWRFMMDPESHIGYVRIAQFNERTGEQLDAALARLRGNGLAGLVLDLRGNGGGSLDAAVKVADRFLKSGAIVSLRGRGERGQSWDATASDEDIEVPLVVLLNNGSASASEVVAGALQDHGRAKVIGTRSYGKGSVQEVRALPDGAGMLKMTTARYYLPSGRTVSRTASDPRWGVEPDSGFHVPMTQTDQLDNLRARRAWEAPVQSGTLPSTRWNDPEWVRESAHDPQLAAALTAMSGYLKTNQWPPVGDLSGQVGVTNDELRTQLDLRRKLVSELDRTDKAITKLRQRGAGTDDPQLRSVAQLIDGVLTVRDRAGHEVARVSIKDPTALERALREIGQKMDAAPQGAPPATPPGAAPTATPTAAPPATAPAAPPPVPPEPSKL